MKIEIELVGVDERFEGYVFDRYDFPEKGEAYLNADNNIIIALMLGTERRIILKPDWKFPSDMFNFKFAYHNGVDGVLFFSNVIPPYDADENCYDHPRGGGAIAVKNYTSYGIPDIPGPHNKSLRVNPNYVEREKA